MWLEQLRKKWRSCTLASLKKINGTNVGTMAVAMWTRPTALRTQSRRLWRSGLQRSWLLIMHGSSARFMKIWQSTQVVQRCIRYISRNMTIKTEIPFTAYTILRLLLNARCKTFSARCAVLPTSRADTRHTSTRLQRRSVSSCRAQYASRRSCFRTAGQLTPLSGP